MSLLIIIIHVFVCIALILIVLLQTGKGADMGAAFGGGGSQTLFGATGASTFLSKMTTGAAVVFMLTSLILAYMASHRTTQDSILSQEPPAAEQPAADTAAPEATVNQDETAPATQETDAVDQNTEPAAETQGTPADGPTETDK